MAYTLERSTRKPRGRSASSRDGGAYGGMQGLVGGTRPTSGRPLSSGGM